MAITVSDFAVGRKTFFITPDTSLFPEHFLEEYFSLGYECYFIDNSRFIPLETKIETIISIFHDVIIFFNIDYEIPGIAWNFYIKRLQDRYPNILIGVTFARKSEKNAKSLLERKYLFDIGIKCGCIQLEYQRRENLEIIQKLLYANQARGRRQNIRALCSKSCTFTFKKQDYYYSGALKDISLSHFSVCMDPNALSLSIWEKVKDVQIVLSGFTFRSDALLIAQRPTSEGMLFVFAFLSPSGEAHLDDIQRARLVPQLYKMMSENCHVMLQKLYEAKQTNGIKPEYLGDISISE